MSAPGLYLHLPFCSSICPYCDFSVLTGGGERRARFVDRLIAEIELHAEAPWPSFAGPAPAAPFDTVYLGGGTPSLLDPADLGRILEALRRHLPLAGRPRIHLEANPEDVDPFRLEAWRALPVDFLSLGVQSFDDRALEFLGRRHRAATSRRAVELALGAGFATLSLDLIYGLPDQTWEDWRRDLETAAALAPGHLSCYQLTVHEGTPFGFRRQRGRLREADSDGVADLFFLTHERLEELGYSAYEVSSFARAPGHRSAHNRKYWRHVPYLGLGPSAHSYHGRWRWWNLRKIRPWEARIAAGEPAIEAHEELGPAELALERLCLGLRTPDGVDLADLPGPDPEETWRRNLARIEHLADAGLLRVEERRLLPTRRGLALADSLAAGFDLDW